MQEVYHALVFQTAQSAPGAGRAWSLARSIFSRKTIPKKPRLVSFRISLPWASTRSKSAPSAANAPSLPDRGDQDSISAGAYYVDFAECNLCEACVPVCPEGVMYVRAELADSAWKCDLCGDCVAVCGTSALWIAKRT